MSDPKVHLQESDSDRLGEWLLRVVGTASTTRSAQMVIETLVANAAAGRVQDHDRYHAALQQIAALPGHSAEWQIIAKEALNG